MHKIKPHTACGTEGEGKQTNEKRKGGREMALLVVESGCECVSSGMSLLLYQHCGCVLQEGGPTHPGAQPEGQRILGGYAC